MRPTSFLHLDIFCQMRITIGASPLHPLDCKEVNIELNIINAQFRGLKPKV